MIGLPPLSPVKQRIEPLLLGSDTRVIWGAFPSEWFLMELTESLPRFFFFRFTVEWTTINLFGNSSLGDSGN